jgi:chromosome segregation ATPase
LEEQVAIVEKDAATSTAKGLEHLDQCSRYEAQVKALEAKLRQQQDLCDQTKAQLVKVVTQADAKDAVIAELREQVKDLHRSGKRSESELKRLGTKLSHEVMERDNFAEQIEGILSEFGIQHRSRSERRDLTPTRNDMTTPTRSPG